MSSLLKKNHLILILQDYVCVWGGVHGERERKRERKRERESVQNNCLAATVLKMEVPIHKQSSSINPFHPVSKLGQDTNSLDGSIFVHTVRVCVVCVVCVCVCVCVCMCKIWLPAGCLLLQTRL